MNQNQNESCQLYLYNIENYSKKVGDAQFFAEHFLSMIHESEQTAWLNFHNITDVDCITQLFDQLKVDRSVVEDIYTQKKRPKIEEYDAYIFFSIRSALPSVDDTMHLQKEQISFVLGDGFLISLQEKKSDHFTTVRERIEVPKGKLRTKKADFLLYRMLEAVVENYFEVLDDITAKSKRLEARVLRSSHSSLLKQIENEKRKLYELRRISMPLRDVTGQIEKSSNPLFEVSNHPYFSDLRDQVMAVLEEIESAKQILDGLTNLYYAVQGQRMNEVMKVLTIFSVTFIPLSFLTGLYGMNFNHMPGADIYNGFFYFLGVMIVIVLGSFWYFKKRGWLNDSF